MRYKIKWRNDRTGATGEGLPVYTQRVVAERVADEKNTKWREDCIRHWVEELPEPPAPED
jgi:hypothetical protein